MDEHKNDAKKTRTYHDQAARTKRVNNYMLLGTTILYIMSFFIVIFQMQEKKENYMFFVIILAFSVICMIVNNYFYRKNPVSETFRYISVGGYALVYALLLFSIGSYYIAVTLVVVLMGAILYYDSKFMSIFASYLLLINILRAIILIVSGTGSTPLVEICSLFVTLICTTTLIFSTRIGGLFIQDTVGAVLDERAHIDEILSEVLDIDATSFIIHDLNDSTNTVNKTVEEIAAGTSSATQSIIDQTHMTGVIQNEIKDTEHSTNNVVSVVKESSHSIATSLQAFEVLKSHQAIVDHISQVTAVFEEITSSTENATSITNNSRLLAEKADTLLHEVLEVSHKLDKYK